MIKGSVEVIKTAYDDALKPVAVEAGKALGTIGQSVNVALAPLRGFVWSWAQIEKWLKPRVAEVLRVRGVPSERVQTPNADIAVPALEAIRYSTLREQFANLIATAMDSAQASAAHPAFVEMLKQMTPDEAKVLNHMPAIGEYVAIIDLKSGTYQGESFIDRHLRTLGADAGCADCSRIPSYINNLCRLGITEANDAGMFDDPSEAKEARLRYSAMDSYRRILESSAFEEAQRRIPLNWSWEIV